MSVDYDDPIDTYDSPGTYDAPLIPFTGVAAVVIGNSVQVTWENAAESDPYDNPSDVYDSDDAYDGTALPVTGYIITPLLNGVAQPSRTVGVVTQTVFDSSSGLIAGQLYSFTVEAVI